MSISGRGIEWRPTLRLSSLVIPTLNERRTQ
jgi:hypothetical protein